MIDFQGFWINFWHLRQTCMPRCAPGNTAKQIAMNPKSQVTVMDGSMGRQLCIEGLPCGELFNKIWAASALADPSYHELIVSAEYVRFSDIKGIFAVKVKCNL